MPTATLTDLHRELGLLARSRRPPFDCTQTAQHELLISKEGDHALGLWTIARGGFQFTQLGSSRPTHFVATVEEAVILTQRLISAN